MAANQDWRNQFLPAARLRIVRNLMDTLKQFLLISYPGALLEHTKIAIRCEEQVYMSAFDQMLALEMRGQDVPNPVPYPLPTDRPNPVDMDNTRWQTLYQPESRLRIVSKILDTSVEHHPLWGPSEFLEATEDAIRFEENVYTTAIDENDYLHKLTLKIMSLEVNDLP